MADYNSEHGGPRFNPLDYPQCFELPKRVSAIGWHEHIPFVKLIVLLLRPKTLVKLGVDEDDLYLALCESAAALGVTCYGIDTKSGGLKTVSVADKQVIKDLHTNHDPQHGSFSRLVKGSSADVVTQFADNSIELLHINGLQTFEEVCKDWEAWRPKVASSGVVMFHGINAREDHIGMWRLWKQLCYAYRYFEFLHGEGLGIIVTGVGIPEPLKVFLSLAEKNPKLIRDFFFALGNRTALRAQLEVANTELKARDARISDAVAQAGHQREEIAELESKRLELSSEIGRLNEVIDSNRRTIDALNGEIKSLDEQYQRLKADAGAIVTLNEKIASLEQSLTKCNADLDASAKKVDGLSAESGSARAELATLKNSTGFKILQVLTLPFRLVRGFSEGKSTKA